MAGDLLNVPARGWGRINATVSLAELTIDEDSLAFRPRLFARLMTGPFQVPLAAIEAANPVRGWLPRAASACCLAGSGGAGQVAVHWATPRPAGDPVPWKPNWVV